MAKASEGGSLVTLRPAGSGGGGRDAGWDSDHDSGMAAALAASLRETEPAVRTRLCMPSLKRRQGSAQTCHELQAIVPHSSMRLIFSIGSNCSAQFVDRT